MRTFGQMDRDCNFDLILQPLPNLAEPVSIAAYRILQEALSNVVKHAAARRCRVTLGTRGDSVVLAVEDDGRGCAPEPEPADGLGLVGMRERASAMGGTFEIHSAPGKGTRLTITLPITAP